MTPDVLIRDYTYELPDDRIALAPLAQRDQSKLLVYRQGKIEHSRFDHLAEILPADSILFFNDTRVIPARLHFTKDTGAVIEIFLLNPVSPPLVQQAMEAASPVDWHCTIGNLKRWTQGVTLEKKTDSQHLTAALIDREKSIVRLSWNPASISFAEVIQSTGAVPLPPYIKREPEAADQHRYQTVYSQADGAVAAPTAGLHFSIDSLGKLRDKGIQSDFLTLHVSAGTFQPVKVEKAFDHPMHTEQVLITRRNLTNLLKSGKKIVAVGTTSLRTLESIYWFGAKLTLDPDAAFTISKNDPYSLPSVPSELAFAEVLKLMDRLGSDTLSGETSIMIMPGYTFRVVEILITNFHQPGSTLMLLVAAFAGSQWREIYDAALANQYRFLSYGDSSVLFGSC